MKEAGQEPDGSCGGGSDTKRPRLEHTYKVRAESATKEAEDKDDEIKRLQRLLAESAANFSKFKEETKKVNEERKVIDESHAAEMLAQVCWVKKKKKKKW